ncbi:MAG: 2-phosphosulfolactate phosphatase [Phycisphaerae bacterium]|nr:2-phosphosulfolactate phosphatase [Gemmatimonadaceae bacterium]
MRIDVLLGDALPTPAEVAGKVVVVIDVLRAATTVVTALANGARAVIPFDSVDEPAVFAKQYERDEIRLAGERRMQRIPGFDLGNSPSEYTAAAVQGRTILYSTTNGTVALLATTGARLCFFAAFVNCAESVTAVRNATRTDGDVLIVCAGHDRRSTLEDVACAGRIARGIARGRTSVVWGDGARAASLIERRFISDMKRLASEATHARSLTAAGFGADVEACLRIDSEPLVVAFHERQLRKYEPAGVGPRLTQPLVRRTR